MKDSENQKSTKTKSAEEILAIAKQQGIELSEEQARELAGFVGAQGGAVGPDGELSDEALADKYAAYRAAETEKVLAKNTAVEERFNH